MAIDDQRAFFQEHWPQLREALEQGGPTAMVAAIQDRPDDEERTALFRFARQGVIMDDWEGKNLDAYVSIADAAIDWLSEQAEASEPAAREEFLGVLAELTFNVAADMADCWTGDDEPRRPDHFERAAEIAEQSVGLRDELDKPHSSKALGWWALGYHQLRLDHTDAAVDSMERSLEHARQQAREDGHPDQIGLQTPFAVLIGAGYLGLARMADDEPSGPDLYAETMAAFRAQLADSERADDAGFGIEQLERVESFLS
ncbi:MAG: hypothetical protein ACR2OI_04515 [Acidimicrobiia bacterium]